LGWLVARVGTLFVERGRRHAVHAINQAVAARLALGESIGVFPEGTTTDGRELLPFHANLVQPALDAGAEIRPVALRYLQDGAWAPAAAYIGDMSLVGSLWRVVTTPRLTVQVHWLPPVARELANRHAVGRAARAAIAAALGLAIHEAHDVTAPAADTADSAPDESPATAS
jgi:1-acyl-sn-glycerol-3-phosphate acyltransferase